MKTLLEMSFDEMAASLEASTGVARLPANPTRRQIDEWWIANSLVIETQRCGDAREAFRKVWSETTTEGGREALSRIGDQEAYEEIKTDRYEISVP